MSSNRQHEHGTAARRPSRVPKRWHAQQDNSALRSHVVAQLRKLFPALDRAQLRDNNNSNNNYNNNNYNHNNNYNYNNNNNNNNNNNATTTTVPGTATVVQRLEWMLYNAAHSRHEYAHACSLERRVQALVTQQLSTTATANVATTASCASPQRCKPTTTTCTKRPRRASLSAIYVDASSLLDSTSRNATKCHTAAAVKRRRRGSFHASSSRPTTSLSLVALPTIRATPPTTTANSTLFLNNDVDLVAQVVAFLGGTDALQAQAVNRFLATHAASMVHTLTLDVRKLPPAAGNQFVTALLLRCTGLRRLVVTNSRNASVSSDGSNALRTDLPRGYSAPLFSSHRHQLYGYEVVAQVTAAFHRDACRALATLELRAPFEFATESDTVVECLGALAHRYMRRDSRRLPLIPSAHVAPTPTSNLTAIIAPLQHLVLDATFLGDARLAQLALVIERSAPFFCGLETLVLRANFAGEAGCCALFAALPRCRQLHSLDVSGNILTDTDARALAYAIRSAGSGRTSAEISSSAHAATQQPLAALQHLALHENFIGRDGFAALSSAMCTRLLALGDDAMDARAGGARSLVRVSCAHNCAPVADAARLFEF